MIPAAVVGVGQTHHKTRRRDVSFGGLVREAVFRALEDAQMTIYHMLCYAFMEGGAAR